MLLLVVVLWGYFPPVEMGFCEYPYPGLRDGDPGDAVSLQYIKCY